MREVALIFYAGSILAAGVLLMLPVASDRPARPARRRPPTPAALTGPDREWYRRLIASAAGRG